MVGIKCISQRKEYHHDEEKNIFNIDYNRRIVAFAKCKRNEKKQKISAGWGLGIITVTTVSLSFLHRQVCKIHDKELITHSLRPVEYDLVKKDRGGTQFLIWSIGLWGIVGVLLRK